MLAISLAPDWPAQTGDLSGYKVCGVHRRRKVFERREGEELGWEGTYEKVVLCQGGTRAPAQNQLRRDQTLCSAHAIVLVLPMHDVLCLPRCPALIHNPSCTGPRRMYH